MRVNHLKQFDLIDTIVKQPRKFYREGLLNLSYSEMCIAITSIVKMFSPHPDDVKKHEDLDYTELGIDPRDHADIWKEFPPEFPEEFVDDTKWHTLPPNPKKLHQRSYTGESEVEVNQLLSETYIKAINSSSLACFIRRHIFRYYVIGVSKSDLVLDKQYPWHLTTPTTVRRSFNLFNQGSLDFPLGKNTPDAHIEARNWVIYHLLLWTDSSLQKGNVSKQVLTNRRYLISILSDFQHSYNLIKTDKAFIHTPLGQQALQKINLTTRTGQVYFDNLFSLPKNYNYNPDYKGFAKSHASYKRMILLIIECIMPNFLGRIGNDKEFYTFLYDTINESNIHSIDEFQAKFQDQPTDRVDALDSFKSNVFRKIKKVLS